MGQPKPPLELLDLEVVLGKGITKEGNGALTRVAQGDQGTGSIFLAMIIPNTTR